MNVEEFEESVRANMKHAREQRGWSQSHLAEKVAAQGVTLGQALISRIELGLRALRVGEMVAIARALGVNPHELLFPGRPDESETVAEARVRLDQARQDAEKLSAAVVDLARDYGQMVAYAEALSAIIARSEP